MELSDPPVEPSFSFGDFSLYPRRKILLSKGKTVSLGGRAFDLLTLLVERSGEVISRDELVAHVWPRAVVEESSLRVHIAAIRRTLGESDNGVQYIATIPGRGYSFVADVVALPLEEGHSQTGPRERAHDNLPARATRIIGRDDVINQLCGKISHRRFISIVGHGGIGKTTVGLAVANQLKSNYPNGVWLIDLSPLTDSMQVWATIGLVLGVSISPDRPLSALSEYVRSHSMLLVLDNCEHLISLSSILVETVLKEAPGVHVLVTSREPLNASGEWVYQLKPLPTPNVDVNTAADALVYPAVELFVERARASSNTFRFRDEEAMVASDICNRLDGLPLAIEFAAARVGILGMHEVAHQLENRMKILSAGRRTALPRHRTLRALLDWSYDLLTSQEQLVFTRLGIFRASFSASDVKAVVSDSYVSPALAEDCLISLVTKSLVSVDRNEAQVGYTMPGVTRDYAYARLLAGSDITTVSTKHAQYMLLLLSRAKRDWEATDTVKWVFTYARWQADIRAAHRWSFSEDGDPILGLELNVAYLPLAIHFPSAQELRRQCEEALTAIRKGGLPARQFQIQQLQAGLHFHDHQIAIPGPGTGRTWEEALTDSEARDDLDEQITLLYWLCTSAFGTGRYKVGDEFSTRSRRIAGRINSAGALTHAARLSALTKHFLGEHRATQEFAHYVTERPTVRVPLLISSSLNPVVSAGLVNARSEWMLGRADNAKELIEEIFETSLKDPVNSTCQVLALGMIPILLWRGEVQEVTQYSDLLISLGGRYGVHYWASWGDLYAQLLQKDTLLAQDIDLEGQFNDKQLDHLVTFDESLFTDRALARVETGDVGWCAPETTRARGAAILRKHGLQAAAAAESIFNDALVRANEQCSLAWSLRAAISKAELLSVQGRRPEARACLEPVYHRLTQGKKTMDVEAASDLLEEIG